MWPVRCAICGKTERFSFRVWFHYNVQDEAPILHYQCVVDFESQKRVDGLE